MKYLKSILALMLAACLLCGCGAELKPEDLTGSWVGTGRCDRTEAAKLLDLIELYEEEREFVDLDSLEYQKCVEFTEDGEYTFTWDAEANSACVRRFYEGVMESLYTNRSELNEVYGTDFDSMSREQFNQFYAELYGLSDYEAMIAAFTASAYDYTSMAEVKVTGEFEIDGPVLAFTPIPEDESEVEAEAEVLGWKLEGGVLTLVYAASEEVYTRAD